MGESRELPDELKDYEFALSQMLSGFCIGSEILVTAIHENDKAATFRQLTELVHAIASQHYEAGYKNGWNSCKDAMLDVVWNAGVNRGEELSDKWNDLNSASRAISRKEAGK